MSTLSLRLSPPVTIIVTGTMTPTSMPNLVNIDHIEPPGSHRSETTWREKDSSALKNLHGKILYYPRHMAGRNCSVPDSKGQKGDFNWLNFISWTLAGRRRSGGCPKVNFLWKLRAEYVASVPPEILGHIHPRRRPMKGRDGVAEVHMGHQ